MVAGTPTTRVAGLPPDLSAVDQLLPPGCAPSEFGERVQESDAHAAVLDLHCAAEYVEELAVA